MGEFVNRGFEGVDDGLDFSVPLVDCGLSAEVQFHWDVESKCKLKISLIRSRNKRNPCAKENKSKILKNKSSKMHAHNKKENIKII